MKRNPLDESFNSNILLSVRRINNDKIFSFVSHICIDYFLPFTKKTYLK